MNSEIAGNHDDHDDDADDVEDHWFLLRLCPSISMGTAPTLTEDGAVHCLTISRTVSFRLPTAFWILPSVCSALPSDCNLASPTALPRASFTEPLIPFAAPAIRSLSMTVCSWCKPAIRAGCINEVAGRPGGTAGCAIPECRSKGRAATSCDA